MCLSGQKAMRTRMLTVWNDFADGWCAGAEELCHSNAHQLFAPRQLRIKCEPPTLLCSNDFTQRGQGQKNVLYHSPLSPLSAQPVPPLLFLLPLNPVLACILLCMLSSGGPVLSSLKCSFCTGRRTGSARLGTSNNHALLIYRQQRLSGERVWLCIKHATQSGLGFAVQTWGELLS